jgi:hypothetical protein
MGADNWRQTWAGMPKALVTFSTVIFAALLSTRSLCAWLTTNHEKLDNHSTWISTVRWWFSREFSMIRDHNGS